MRGGAWEGEPCREEHGRVDLRGWALQGGEWRVGLEGRGCFCLSLLRHIHIHVCIYSVALLNPSG